MPATKERAPWRKVIHIESRDTKRGGIMWTLILECEHLSFKYAPNPQWKVFKPEAHAPYKRRCLACKLASKG